MKRLPFVVIIIGLLIAGFSMPAAADEEWDWPHAGYTYPGYEDPPDWSGNPYYTHQSWDFMAVADGGGNAVPPGGGVIPQESPIIRTPYQSDAEGHVAPWVNPYGTPLITGTAPISGYVGEDPDHAWEWTDWGMGMETDLYYGHYGGMGSGYVEFQIPNHADLKKEIWLQYIVYLPRGGPGPDGATVISFRTDTATMLNKDFEMICDTVGYSGYWYRVTEKWEIEPPSGTIYLKLEALATGGPTVLIDAVDIDTRCIIPPTVDTPTFSPTPGTYPSAQDVTIRCSTGEAAIYYTIDGSEPTKSSPKYNSAPVPIATTTTLKARAFKTGWTASEIASGLYTITGTIATPTFDPSPGTYPSAQDVTIRCSTGEAAIYYTIDGSEPTKSSPKYNSAPVHIATTTTLKARAFKTGWTASEIASGLYTITGTIATPTFDPPSDAYPLPQDVTISCSTQGAAIYYTIDGSEPTEKSLKYSAPVTIATTTTLKAKAFKTGWTQSGIASGLYTITGTIAVPTFLPASGTEFTSSLDIEISCSTEDVTVYYTIDGTDPTESSTPYTDPITIDETTTFKAKAFREGWTASAVATASYTKTGTVAAPTFDPGPGSYSTAQTVTISCDTDDTTIYYTTDGSEPTDDGSSPYTEAVTISATTTLKARAFKAGLDPGDIASGLYTIEESWSDNPCYTHQSWEFNSLDIDPDTPGWQLPECSDEGKEVAISPGVPGIIQEGSVDPDPPLAPDKLINGQLEDYTNDYGTPYLICVHPLSEDEFDWTWYSMGGLWERCGKYGGMADTKLIFLIPNAEAQERRLELRLRFALFSRYECPDAWEVIVGRSYNPETHQISDIQGIVVTSEECETEIDAGDHPWHSVSQIWEFDDQPSEVYVSISAFSPSATLIDQVKIDTRSVETITPPIVDSTLPENGATVVKVNSAISITFTKPMHKEVTEGAFSISQKVDGHFSWKDIDKTMVFTPEAYLLCDAGYSVTISADAAEAVGGVNLADGHTFSFTTEPYTTLVPEFDGMPEGTVNTDEAAITVGGPGVYRYRYRLDDSEWSDPCALSDPLVLSGLSDGEHTLYVQVEDAEMTWHEIDSVTWTVAVPPSIVSISPGDGQSAPTSAKIMVVFSEAMNTDSVENAFTIAPYVAGGFTWSENTMTFTPESDLTSGITYTVTIDSSVEDLAGNALESPCSWSFTTLSAGTAVIRCPVEADTYVLTASMGGGPGKPCKFRLMAGACPIVNSRILVRFDLSELEAFDPSQIVKAEVHYYMLENEPQNPMSLESPAPEGTPMYGFVYALNATTYEYTELGLEDTIPHPDGDELWFEVQGEAPNFSDLTHTWRKTKPGYVPGFPMIVATHTTGPFSWGLIDITEIVKGWVRGDYPNNGMELKDHDDRSYDCKHEEGFPWYWASKENSDSATQPYLLVEVDANRLRIADKPSTLPDLEPGQTVAFGAAGGTGLYTWQATGPDGSNVTSQVLSETTGDTTTFTSPATAGLYWITVSDGTGTDNIRVVVLDPDSYYPDEELYGLSQNLFPLFMGGDISQGDQEAIYGICEKTVNDIGASGMLGEIMVNETVVGGTGKSHAARTAIVIVDDLQAQQVVSITDEDGNIVCAVEIPEGGIDERAGSKIYAVATDTGISSWGAASRVYSFAFYDEAGEKLDNSLISNVVITISFNTDLIVSDQLLDGTYSILYTEDTGKFFTAEGDDPKETVPVSNISDVNYDQGWIKFQLDHLTTFGIQQTGTGSAGITSSEETPSLGGGCFIDTAAYGSILNYGLVLTFYILAMCVATTFYFRKREK